MCKVEHPTCLGKEFIDLVAFVLNLLHSKSPCMWKNGVDTPTVTLEMQIDITMQAYGMS